MLSKLLSSFDDESSYLYGAIAILVVIMLFMWHHANTLQSDLSKAKVALSQEQTINKDLNNQIKLNDELILQNDEKQASLVKEASHAKDLYSRYFHIYKNYCAMQPIPVSVVKRLRQSASNKRANQANIADIKAAENAVR